MLLLLSLWYLILSFITTWSSQYFFFTEASSSSTAFSPIFRPFSVFSHLSCSPTYPSSFISHSSLSFPTISTGASFYRNFYDLHQSQTENLIASSTLSSSFFLGRGVHNVRILPSISKEQRGKWFSSLQAMNEKGILDDNTMKKKSINNENNNKNDDLINHVVILGGGFGGLYTALKLSELYTSDQFDNLKKKKSISELRSQRKLKITVLDQNDRFLFLPLLYDLSVDDASQEEVAPTFVDLFKNQPFIDFQQGIVCDLDREKKCISYATKDGEGGVSNIEEISYDKVLIALGSESNWDSIPGSKENAMTFNTLENAMLLKESLENLPKKFIRVVVIGGGYAGVEVSSSIMQKLGRNKCSVTLITRGQGDNAILGNTSSSLNRDVAIKRLDDLDVDVIEGASVKRIESEGRVIIDSNTETDKKKGTEQIIHGDIIINTSGAKCNPIINDFPLTLDKTYGNRIRVTDLLQTIDDPNIFAIGDNAIIEGMEELPTTAQVAFQQAEYAAWNIYYSLLTQKRERQNKRAGQRKAKTSMSSFSTSASSVMIKPLAFRYLNLGEMLSLGTNHAAVSTLNDKIEVKGLLGSLARRLVYAIRMPTLQQQTTSIRSVVKSTIRSLRG